MCIFSALTLIGSRRPITRDLMRSTEVLGSTAFVKRQDGALLTAIRTQPTFILQVERHRTLAIGTPKGGLARQVARETLH